MMLGDSLQTSNVEAHLKTLEITVASEWDVLAFLYRHNTSLARAEHIAQLIGYDKAPIGAALDKLASLGLIQRSRASQGARLYGYSISSDTTRQNCVEELMRLAETRAGRVAIVQSLRQMARRKQAGASGSLRLV